MVARAAVEEVDMEEGAEADTQAGAMVEEEVTFST